MSFDSPMETAGIILNALHQPALVLDGVLRPLIASLALCQMFGLALTDDGLENEQSEGPA